MAEPSEYTGDQAARLLRIHPRTLANWRRAGHIGFHRTPGGRIFYTLDQIANCRARMRVDPPPP